MRWLCLLVALLLTACGGSFRHVTLPDGGRVDAVPRLGVADAAALPDGRIVIAAGYSTSHRGTDDWMDDGGGGIVACLERDGSIAWAHTLSPSGAPRHRVAVTADGTTWVLAQPLVDPRSLVPPVDGVVLSAVDPTGRMIHRLGMASLGWRAPDAVPYFLAAAPGGGVIAVAGTSRTIAIVGVGADGRAHILRRIERATDSPGAHGIRVVGTIDGTTLWLAGAGTTLSFADDPTYQGPIVAAVSVETGEVRQAFPLETALRPEGWDYPSAIAVVEAGVVLARSSAGRSRVTLHDPGTFAEVRTVFAVEGADVDALAPRGDDAVLAVLHQTGHRAVRYGAVTVNTRTAPPTSDALVAVSLPIAGGDPHAIWVARTRSAEEDGIGGGAGTVTALTLAGEHVIVGTFWAVLGVGGELELHGTYGTEDQCMNEDTFHTPGCESVAWNEASAFIVRVPR
jgi:hypothetical protein